MLRSGGEKGIRLSCSGKLGVPPEGEGMSGNFLSCITGVKYPFDSIFVHGATHVVKS